jgi:hypothetical protein
VSRTHYSDGVRVAVSINNDYPTEVEAWRQFYGAVRELAKAYEPSFTYFEFWGVEDP